MAVPVVETFSAAATNSSPATSITIDKPTGIVSGELGQAMLMSDDNSASQAWNAETGWVGPESGISGGDATSDNKVAVLTREFDGTEGATFTFDCDNADDLMAWMQRISGANNSAPFNVKASAPDHTNGSSHVLTGVTTTAPNCLGFYYFHMETADGDPFTVSGTGWSESDEGDSGGTADQGSGCWGTKSMASAGATGNATVTSSVSDNSNGAIWAIVEEAAAGGANPKGPLGHPLHGPLGGPI